MNRNRLLYSVVVLAVLYILYDAQAWLVRIPAYRHLYRGHPFYVPEGIKTSLQILICLAAIALSLGKNSRRTFTELGLDRGFSKGLLFGFLATVPFFHRVGNHPPLWQNRVAEYFLSRVLCAFCGRAVDSRLRIRSASSSLWLALVAGNAAYRGFIWLGPCGAGRQFS